MSGGGFGSGPGSEDLAELTPRQVAQRLREMSRYDEFVVGTIPESALGNWPFHTSSVTRITGDRRRKYLHDHPEVRSVEHLVIEAIRSPRAAFKNKPDGDRDVVNLVVDGPGQWDIWVSVRLPHEPMGVADVQSARMQRKEETARQANRMGRQVWRR